MLSLELNIIETFLIHKEGCAAIIQDDLGPILDKLAESY
jgi:hypothetical protein